MRELELDENTRRAVRIAALAAKIGRYLYWTNKPAARALRAEDAHVDADDLSQECALKAWKHAAKYDAARGSELTFARTIAISVLRDRKRYAYERKRYAPIKFSLDETAGARVGSANPNAEGVEMGSTSHVKESAVSESSRCSQLANDANVDMLIESKAVIAQILPRVNPVYREHLERAIAPHDEPADAPPLRGYFKHALEAARKVVREQDIVAPW